MDPSSLDSLAESSITLAGFASVFRAFATGEDPDGRSKLRLNAVIEGGVVIAFICFLPSALRSASFSDATAFRAASSLGGLWLLLRGVIPGIQIIRTGWPRRALFPLAFALSLGSLVAFGAGGLGIASPGGAHHLGALVLFGGIAGTFLAQFRVELAS